MPVTKSDGSTVQHLVVPYSLDTNDMRFVQAQGFNTGDHFFTYLRDSFDTLYAEGDTAPKMMSIGMHCRLLGKPGRISSLQRFLDHLLAHDKVWVCRRIDIARHWKQHHPAPRISIPVSSRPHAGIHSRLGLCAGETLAMRPQWIPACAGMTVGVA